MDRMLYGRAVRAGESSMLRAETDLHASAQDLRIGISGLAAVICVVGQYGEQGGVDARQPARKVGALIAAEIDVYADRLVVKTADLCLDGSNIVTGSDHRFFIPPAHIGRGASYALILPVCA